MKTKNFLAAIGLAAISVYASAGSGTADFAIGGTALAVCNFSSATFSLGAVDLLALTVQTGQAGEHARVPVTIPVVCNSETLPWVIYQAGVSPFALGSVVDNNVCVVNDTSSDATPDCALIGSTGNSQIAGVGSATKNAALAIWNTTGTRTAYKGMGLISATIPLIISF